MNLLHLPWLELAIAITLIGPPCVSRLRNPDRVYRWSVALIGATFGCTVLAWLAFYVDVPPESLARWSIQPALFGRQIFGLDELNAPLLPTVASPALPGGPVDLADVHAAVLVLLVDGRRDDPPAEIQLQGTVDLDRPAGDLDRAAVRGTAQPPQADAGIRPAHGAVRGAAGAGLVGRDARRRNVCARPPGGPSLRSWPRSSSAAAPCPPIAG